MSLLAHCVTTRESPINSVTVEDVEVHVVADVGFLRFCGDNVWRCVSTGATKFGAPAATVMFVKKPPLPADDEEVLDVHGGEFSRCKLKQLETNVPLGGSSTRPPRKPGKPLCTTASQAKAISSTSRALHALPPSPPPTSCVADKEPLDQKAALTGPRKCLAGSETR